MALRRGRHFDPTAQDARLSRGTRFAPDERVRTMPKLAEPGEKAVVQEAPRPEGQAPSPDDTSMWLSVAASAGVTTGGTTSSPDETASWIALVADSDARLQSQGRPQGQDEVQAYAYVQPQRQVEDEVEPSGRAATGHGAASQAQPAEAAAPQADDAEQVGATVGRSAALISVLVMISRITGFIRTWAMGFAMGTTLLSSSYQVACNLPNQLYELVMGGMLVTAFLPVYVSLRKREGLQRANAYASTLLGIVVVVLGAVALLTTIFAPQVVYTQMFLNPAGDRELVTYFFRFFAIQLLFYGVSAIVGGLLNASRDYFWSSAAPIANNLVVIAVMFAYVFIAPNDPELGKLVIAIGTPLGVFTQMAIQIPALARSGIRLRPRINLRDPALRETLALGIPTIVVTLASFATVSVQNAAAMAVSDAGSSILYYARQWFTLPYAFLSVPLTTTLFTELSDMAAEGNRDGMRRAVAGGTRQNLFFMIPFALYLAVFSVPLVSLFCAGSFTQESVEMVASYLSVMAISLPFYALFMFMQKVFSAIRRMRAYAVLNLVISVVQVVLTLLWCLGVGDWDGWGINGVALAQTVFFVLGDIWCYVYLHRVFGRIEAGSILRSALGSLGLGLLGAAAGAIVLWLLTTFVGPIGGSIARAALYLVPSGIVALLVTFGPAVALRIPEAAFIRRLLARVIPALRR